jgi:hypothetical protein
MGGSGDDSGRVIATDKDGNSTIAGWFEEKARFGATTLN